MAYTQDGRLIAIDTPLGDDALLLQGLSGVEGISRLFRFDLDLLSEDDGIEVDDLLGQGVTIRLQLQSEDTTRCINGVVSGFTRAESDARLTHYRMEVVPWLWLLTRTADCRIFQNQTIPQIIEQVFKEAGFSDYRLQLQGSFASRDYCVQYRETDFNFVSRLMEQCGIYYFFEHAEKKHTLVLCNSPTGHAPCPQQPAARYEITQGMHQEDVITAWAVAHMLRPGKHTVSDFHFETPRTSLLTSLDSTHPLATGLRYEVYDYPGEYTKPSEGEQLVRLWVQEEDCQRIEVRGRSTCRAFSSGYRFDLQGHDRRDFNGAYVLTEVRHRASVGSAYRSGIDAGAEDTYTNSFACIPHAVPYRPPRRTPQPIIAGAQTAIVVGPQGEEIHTDEFGRVKVQFHWDREGKNDEKSSCWIRVAQEWAGKRWGAMFLPRKGQEVVVKFLEGDPDRPLVVGRVYNAEHMPPYALAAEQTKSTIKSLTSKGGGGFNELRFEDAKGKEQLFLNAERQQDTRVEEDSLEWVGRDRHLIVADKQFEHVKRDKHLRVRGDQNEQVDGAVSQKIGTDLDEKVGMKAAAEAGMEIHLKAGMNVVIEAGMTVTVKAGGAFIVVGPSGVSLSGMPILINSGGAAGAGSGASPDAPKRPKEADKDEPGEKAQIGPKTVSPQAAALRQAARDGRPFCEKCAEAARQAALARGATPEEAEAEARAAGLAGAERERRPTQEEADDEISDAQADVLGQAAEDGTPFCEECARAAVGVPTQEEALEEAEGEAKLEGPEEEAAGLEEEEAGAAPPTSPEKAFIAIQLLDEAGNPVPGARYRIILPDGKPVEGVLDAEGRARVEGVDPGECQVCFPDLEGWEHA